jgi:hypothetical protein
MSDQTRRGDSINANISGNISGNVAVGRNISQIHNVCGHQEVTKEDRAVLQQLLNTLTTQIEAEAPAEKKDAAIERVEELKEAITSEKPDLTTMEYVKKWFGKNLPQLVGYVTGVLINPVVGKVVEATGEIASGELKKRFGH